MPAARSSASPAQCPICGDRQLTPQPLGFVTDGISVLRYTCRNGHNFFLPADDAGSD